MAKRQAYTRRDSGEVTKHEQRGRVGMEINAAEIRSACNKMLKGRNIPINTTEEAELKRHIKNYKDSKRDKKKSDNQPVLPINDDDQTQSEYSSMPINKIKESIKIEVEEAEHVSDCILAGMDLAIHMITRKNRRLDIYLIRDAIIEMESKRSGIDYY